jgi:hypothetical protein
VVHGELTGEDYETSPAGSHGYATPLRASTSHAPHLTAAGAPR